MEDDIIVSSLSMLKRRYNALFTRVSSHPLCCLSYPCRPNVQQADLKLSWDVNHFHWVWCNNSRLLNQYWVPTFTLFRGCVGTLWSALLLVWYCLVSKNVILPLSFITSYLPLPIPVGRVLIKWRSIPLSECTCAQHLQVDNGAFGKQFSL